MAISTAKMRMGMRVHGGLGKSSRSSTNLKEIQMLDSCEGHCTCQHDWVMKCSQHFGAILLDVA